MKKTVGSVTLIVSVLLAAHTRAEPFLDRVVDATIGTGGGAGAPELVLGPPHGAGALQGSTDTLSLGLGGTIQVAFDDNVVVDAGVRNF